MDSCCCCCRIRPLRKGLIFILLDTKLRLEQTLLAGHPFQFSGNFCEYVGMDFFEKRVLWIRVPKILKPQ